jgi:hypothetical protein
MTRKKVPENIETQVLDACKRRCALCVAIDNNHAEVLGQVAHLDKDNTNFRLGNLAFLCLRHHSLYDSKNSQHKNYTQAEVVLYRNRVNALYGSIFSTEEKGIIRSYLNENIQLLLRIANAGDQMAVEINAEVYDVFSSYISAMHVAKILCFNDEIASVLESLNFSIASIWEIISDENYIASGRRVKFNNTHDPNRNVQAILASKRVEIVPHQIAVNNYIEVLEQMAR